MEEKKPLKIKFKTAVIIIVTAVVLLGIGANVYATKQGYDNIFFLIKYKITGEPKETITGKDNLLTDRDIETKQSIEKNTNVESMPFTEKEIEESIQKYLDLVGAKWLQPDILLTRIGLLKEDDVGKLVSAKTEGYLKTNIKYSKFKEVMLNYVTEKCFEKEDILMLNDVKAYIEENGCLCVVNGGSSGGDYVVEKISKVNDKTYNAKVRHMLEEGYEEYNYEFGIENYNGKCVINYCHKTDSKI